MRVSTAEPHLVVEPGADTTVVVDVVNTGVVIDGISASVIGLPGEFVTSRPSLLPLFPATGGQLTLSLAIPPAYPAGTHPITVELISHGAHGVPQYLDVDVQVGARPSMAVTASPRLVRARRSGRFAIAVTNDGNVPLDVSLVAVDLDRASAATFTPGQVRVEPGSTVPVLLDVRGPRMFTGAELDRVVQVVVSGAVAVPIGAVEPDPADALQPGGFDTTVLVGEVPVELPAAPALAPRSVEVTLKQRPLIARGLLTALVLMTILALWAGAFLFGLTSVFSGDPMTKAAPASFFAATTNTSNFSGGTNAAPAGALPKTGQVPPGVGGDISGVVKAASTQAPIGRVLVEAWRQSRTGLVRVSSAATQSDGTYTLAGLFPTDYYLKFSAPAYTTVWFPQVPAQKAATPIAVGAQQTNSIVPVVVSGHPATISGTVDPGDTSGPAPTTVTARPLNLAGSPRVPAPVVTDGAHAYRIVGLPAPATYQLTFVTAGYQTTTIIDTVDGGDARIEPSVELGATQGSITGIVVNGTRSDAPPVGGATVSTTVGGKAVTVMTPTTGVVGSFALPNLPTPATYVVTYSAPGFGSYTQVIHLSAGASDTTARGQLTGGSGSITGHVYDGDSTAKPPAGLGGVSVTVGGLVVAGSTDTAPAAPSTTTLTGGDVGRFLLNGLPAGTYTLTFSHDGYAPASVLVTLSADSVLQPLKVTLQKDSGEITGTVRRVANGKAARYAGATITATDGVATYTALSSDPGGQLPTGDYDMAGVPAGVYTVTVTGPDITPQTQIVRLTRSAVRSGIDFRAAAS